MAFLDNSGDIILDAVLTDVGRGLLAKGDGSFNITSFCFADDEIDYGLYDNAHSGGTEYFDLQILQTPILEALTYNLSQMKARLVTYASNDLLWLPTLVLNDGKDPETNAYKSLDASAWKTYGETEFPDGFIVAVDKVTEKALMCKGAQGIIRGENPTAKTRRAINGFIRIEQGLDTDEINATNSLSALFPELLETQYDIEIDSRLGRVVGVDGGAFRPAYISDNLTAIYRVSITSNPEMVYNIGSQTQNFSDADAPKVRGPRGTRVDWKITSTLELQTSNYLFNKFGTTPSTWADTTYTTGNPIRQNDLNTRAIAGELKYIDSIVRVTGVTTGASIDINVRFLKCTGCVEKKTST